MTILHTTNRQQQARSLLPPPPPPCPRRQYFQFISLLPIQSKMTNYLSIKEHDWPQWCNASWWLVNPSLSTLVLSTREGRNSFVQWLLSHEESWPYYYYLILFGKSFHSWPNTYCIPGSHQPSNMINIRIINTQRHAMFHKTKQASFKKAHHKSKSNHKSERDELYESTPIPFIHQKSRDEVKPS